MCTDAILRLVPKARGGAIVLHISVDDDELGAGEVPRDVGEDIGADGLKIARVVLCEGCVGINVIARQAIETARIDGVANLKSAHKLGPLLGVHCQDL